MKILRTPDDSFKNLSGYPFKPNYMEIPDGEGKELRIHYIDEGSDRCGTYTTYAWRTQLVLSIPENDSYYH